MRSCVTPVAGALNQPVTTLEGLGTEEKPHALQTAFIDQQAAQCGYCTNGMIMAASAFLKVTPRPTEEQIQKAMTPYLCRCGTHFPNRRCDPASGEGDGVGDVQMTDITTQPRRFDRRKFVVGSGALVVAIGTPRLLNPKAAFAQATDFPIGPAVVDPLQVDS